MTDLFERPAMESAVSSRAALRERRAAKKRRKRRRRNSIVVAVILLVLVGGGYFTVKNVGSLFGGFEMPFATKDYAGPGHGSVTVTVPEGATGTQIGQTLVDAGVVESLKAFNAAFDQNPGSKGIQPGSYDLRLEMTAADAVALLVANKQTDGTRLTINAGWTRAQIVKQASSVTGVPAAEFEAALADPATIGLPAEAGGNPEGWLFATTYVLNPHESAVDIVRSMVAQTVGELDALGVPADKRETVLNKAALIEREAKFDADRPVMARAIENRLAKDMVLQIDASVAYGLKKSGMELTKSDLGDASNPYNLYKVKGLPPGPIASPSRASISAALAPAAGDWLYWCTVNLETGETKFSVTYEEQQAAQAQLKQWQHEHPSSS